MHLLKKSYKKDWIKHVCTFNNHGEEIRKELLDLLAQVHTTGDHTRVHCAPGTNARSASINGEMAGVESEVEREDRNSWPAPPTTGQRSSANIPFPPGIIPRVPCGSSACPLFVAPARRVPRGTCPSPPRAATARATRAPIRSPHGPAPLFSLLFAAASRPRGRAGVGWARCRRSTSMAMGPASNRPAGESWAARASRRHRYEQDLLWRGSAAALRRRPQPTSLRDLRGRRVYSGNKPCGDAFHHSKSIIGSIAPCFQVNNCV